MKKRTRGVIIALFIVTMSFVLISHVNHNRKMGEEMFSSAREMSLRCHLLVESLTFMQNHFSQEEPERSTAGSNFLYSCIVKISPTFGYDQVPFDIETRTKYLHRVIELRDLIGTDEKELTLFTSQKGRKYVADLIKEFEFLADSLDNLQHRYENMSETEKWCTSWKKEQKLLSEQVDIEVDIEDHKRY